jgi:hypothetical protein
MIVVQAVHATQHGNDVEAHAHTHAFIRAHCVQEGVCVLQLLRHRAET